MSLGSNDVSIGAISMYETVVTRLGIIRIISEPSKWLSAAIYQQENVRLSLIDASMRAILNYEAKCFDNFEGRRCTLTIYLLNLT